MKPSDARVRQKKDQLQQARNARGKSWQDDLLAVLGASAPAADADGFTPADDDGDMPF
mgnify:CR=1 FL=1